MDNAWWALCGTTFVTVFVAELGDKTQLAALGLATRGSPWAVFWGSALALVFASALAVGVGKLLADRLDPRWLHYGGALLFLAIGLALLIRGPETTSEPPTPPSTEPAGAAEEAPGD